MEERRELVQNMRQKISDISVEISWMAIANQYFGRSSSWLYHKLDGKNGNGGPGGFTKEEAEQLRSALLDLANRIVTVAKNI